MQRLMVPERATIFEYRIWLGERNARAGSIRCAPFVLCHVWQYPQIGRAIDDAHWEGDPYLLSTVY